MKPHHPLFTLIGLLASLVAGANDTTCSLAGPWRFALDREDVGLAEAWCLSRLPGSIQLPGALQDQGFGDPSTFWHTGWEPTNDPMPHQVIIDLGREVDLAAITALPRQDQANGRIAEARFFVSDAPDRWDNCVASVRWSDTGRWQRIALPRPIRARYLKMVVDREIHGNPFASLAELDVVPADVPR